MDDSSLELASASVQRGSIEGCFLRCGGQLRSCDAIPGRMQLPAPSRRLSAKPGGRAGPDLRWGGGRRLLGRTKRNQADPGKTKEKSVWFSLDSLVRIETFQWVTEQRAEIFLARP